METLKELVEKSDILVLAIKPQILDRVLDDLKELNIKETLQNKRIHHKKIQPKSKKEVDILMYELEEFLE